MIGTHMAKGVGFGALLVPQSAASEAHYSVPRQNAVRTTKEISRQPIKGQTHLPVGLIYRGEL